MASCENCGRTGIDFRDVVVAVKDGTYILAGPCCAQTPLNYGLEISSVKGLRAYVEGRGFSLEFHQTPEQLKELYATYVGT